MNILYILAFILSVLMTMTTFSAVGLKVLTDLLTQPFITNEHKFIRLYSVYTTLSLMVPMLIPFIVLKDPSGIKISGTILLTIAIWLLSVRSVKYIIKSVRLTKDLPELTTFTNALYLAIISNTALVVIFIRNEIFGLS